MTLRTRTSASSIIARIESQGERDALESYDYTDKKKHGKVQESLLRLAADELSCALNTAFKRAYRRGFARAKAGNGLYWK